MVKFIIDRPTKDVDVNESPTHMVRPRNSVLQPANVAVVYRLHCQGVEPPELAPEIDWPVRPEEGIPTAACDRFADDDPVSKFYRHDVQDLPIRGWRIRPGFPPDAVKIFIYATRSEVSP